LSFIEDLRKIFFQHFTQSSGKLLKQRVVTKWNYLFFNEYNIFGIPSVRIGINLFYLFIGQRGVALSA
jgi:hypothetical protein